MTSMLGVSPASASSARRAAPDSVSKGKVKAKGRRSRRIRASRRVSSTTTTANSPAPPTHAAIAAASSPFTADLAALLFRALCLRTPALLLYPLLAQPVENVSEVVRVDFLALDPPNPNTSCH